jgi:hypothetical protein
VPRFLQLFPDLLVEVVDVRAPGAMGKLLAAVLVREQA